MKVLDFFRKSPEKAAALALYRACVAQARQPGFYGEGSVPDTVDGRFDMIAIHVFLALYRLKGDRPRTAGLAQEVFDLMFADMDQNLRELGVGDLAVGKRIRKMTSAFQGRIVAYEQALLATPRQASQQALMDALKRNLFRHGEPAPESLTAIADYMIRETQTLAGQSTEALMTGSIAFGEPSPSHGIRQG
ncbi:MAG: ubiquinol-cytochrome C chaperone family protein [Rhodospirillales bacterium]